MNKVTNWSPTLFGGCHLNVDKHCTFSAWFLARIGTMYGLYLLGQVKPTTIVINHTILSQLKIELLWNLTQWNDTQEHLHPQLPFQPFHTLTIYQFPSPPNAHKHEIFDNNKVRDYLNATIWANHCNWWIKINYYFILSLLEITISYAHLQVQIQFHAIVVV